MANIAFLPVRGGSQSIPLKNIKLINGQPLIFWSLDALQKSKKIDQIVVSTDSDEIAKVVHEINFSKIRIFKRSLEHAQNHSSTESAMLEYIQSQPRIKGSDVFVLVQATNPFTTENDFDLAIKLFKSKKSANSLLSVVRTKRFFWDPKKANPLNYNPKKRPRRQDYEGLFMENGAFYVSTVKSILKSKNRLTAPILTYEMPEHSGFEIDEPDDWIICAELLKKHKPELRSTLKKIKLFLSDVDGVLTDAGMYYTENGDEIKKFCTYDGLAFKLIQKQGIKVGILTAEDRNLNRRRAKKLNLDFDFHGIENKLAVLTKLTQDLGIDLSEVAYVGDDINDIEVLKKVGFAFCPNNAQPEVRRIPNIRLLKSSGGNGAIREISRIIL